MSPWIVTAALVLGSGCEGASMTCDELEARIATLTRDEDDQMRIRAGAGPYVPLWGAFAAEVGASCRAGALDATARRCYAAARSSLDLDRCAASHD